ncbi:hypothetical protein D3C83_285770 [compost metagenome]
MLMMPDWALPNSAEEAPVVTEACSNPLIPIWMPPVPPCIEEVERKPVPRYPGVVGTPSM